MQGGTRLSLARSLCRVPAAFATKDPEIKTLTWQHDLEKLAKLGKLLKVEDRFALETAKLSVLACVASANF